MTLNSAPKSISVFDLFKIGIGPSSSHTAGPMIAARRFAMSLERQELLSLVSRIRCDLFGSLGATGIGHGSVQAIILGLENEQPDQIDLGLIADRLTAIRSEKHLNLLGRFPVPYVHQRSRSGE